MDLKKVSRIPQNYKDIISGYVKEMQNIFPDDNSYYNISGLIVHVILLYYYTFIESNLFTNDEIDELFNLLLSNKKDIANDSWSLIFESTKYGIARRKFVNEVHGKENILILFKLKGEIIFGGYTKTGWATKRPGNYSADKDAFVFLLKSPEDDEAFISNVKQDEDSIKHALSYYTYSFANFGNRWIFYVLTQVQSLHIQDHPQDRHYANFEPFKHGKNHLYGSNSSNHMYSRDEFEFEVFQITP